MFRCLKCAKLFKERHDVRKHLREIHKIKGYPRTGGTGKRYTSLITPQHEKCEYLKSMDKLRQISEKLKK